MACFEIEIAGVEYVGETASAREQFQALHVAANSRLLIGMQEGVTDKGLVLSLMALDWADLQRLESLLIKGDKVKRAEDSVPVAANLFQDDPASYALLIGQVARENLAGFYALRGQKSADAEQAAKP